MEKNEKGKFDLILVIIIVILLIIGIIAFALNQSKVASVLTEIPVTKEADDYSKSLSEIISGVDLSGNFDVKTEYKGTKYNFKCTSFNEELNACVTGSVLLTVDGELFPLFIFDEANKNYLNSADDYHIVVKDNNVVVYYINDYISEMKIYNRKGETLNVVSDIFLRDSVTGEFHAPVVTDKVIEFNKCLDTILYTYVIDLSNPVMMKMNQSGIQQTCN